MMLICWVIGHRLPQDKVRQFVSTTVGDALATFETGNHVDTLLQLHMVRKVLEQLAKMIRTRLPLPKERNPFYGEDFVADDEDKVVPRAELWAYGEEPGEGLSPDERHEFDVKHNPSILLRPLESRVLIPQTKLSLLAIQWVTRNFGLGKKVFSRRDIDPTMFWNADPPAFPHSCDFVISYQGAEDQDKDTNNTIDDLTADEDGLDIIPFLGHLRMLLKSGH